MNHLTGAKCLVTGGAGFVGSAIVDQLLEAGVAEVRVLDNFTRGNTSNLAQAVEKGGVIVTEGDVSDRELVDNLIQGTDYVFHQAALRITRCAEAPREAVDVLIGGTLNVLDSATRHRVKKVVAASSASVYGEPSYLPIDEIHPFNNRTLYGAGKIAGEQMLRAYYTTSGLPYVALRYFNVYGPRAVQVGLTDGLHRPGVGIHSKDHQATVQTLAGGDLAPADCHRGPPNLPEPRLPTLAWRMHRSSVCRALSTANTTRRPSLSVVTATPGLKAPPELAHGDHSPLGTFCHRCSKAPSVSVLKSSSRPSAFCPTASSPNGSSGRDGSGAPETSQLERRARRKLRARRTKAELRPQRSPNRPDRARRLKFAQLSASHGFDIPHGWWAPWSWFSSPTPSRSGGEVGTCSTAVPLGEAATRRANAGPASEVQELRNGSPYFTRMVA